MYSWIKPNCWFFSIFFSQNNTISSVCPEHCSARSSGRSIKAHFPFHCSLSLSPAVTNNLCLLGLLETQDHFSFAVVGVHNLTGVKVSTVTKGFCDLTLKLWIKYNSLQKFSFTSWMLHLIKRHLLLTFACIQHHFKFTAFWTTTTKCAVKKQTGSYLCQAVSCRSKHFLVCKGHYLEVWRQNWPILKFTHNFVSKIQG